MKTSAVLVSVLFSIAVAATVQSQPIRELIRRPDFRLYTVVFGVTLDERGKIAKFRVAAVTDAKSDSKARLAVKVPERFVAAARQKVETDHPAPRLKKGKPAEFFTFFFYAPDYPNNVISDLYLPPANQP
jgi:hypothetical protein